MVSIVVEKDYRAIFDLACNPFANAIWRCILFPVKGIIIRYKSKEFFTKSLKRLLLHNMSQYVKICMVFCTPKDYHNGRRLSLF